MGRRRSGVPGCCGRGGGRRGRGGCGGPGGQVGTDHHQDLGGTDRADRRGGGVCLHQRGRHLEGLGDLQGRLLVTGQIVDARLRNLGGHVDRRRQVPTGRLELGRHRRGRPGHARCVGHQHRDLVSGQRGGCRADLMGRCGGGGDGGGGGRPDGRARRRFGRGRVNHAEEQHRGHHEGHQHDGGADHRSARARSARRRVGLRGAGHCMSACQPRVGEARLSEPGAGRVRSIPRRARRPDRATVEWRWHRVGPGTGPVWRSW